MKRLLPIALVLLLAIPAHAVEPSEMLSDPALEARARAIGQELRCVVCQNESVDTSNAGIAHDMRVLIRERLKEGQSDRQIVDYLRSRYGDFILLDPPVTRGTALLWAAPVLALLAGTGIVIHTYLRPRRRIAR